MGGRASAPESPQGGGGDRPQVQGHLGPATCGTGIGGSQDDAGEGAGKSKSKIDV